jgi:hypothetical protein
MRYATFSINPRKSYGITIGSRDKPDSQFRETVRENLDRAMESFELEEDQGYSIAIVQDTGSAESGLPEIPSLNNREQYLIFALLNSDPDSGDSLTERELEEYRVEIWGMLRGVLGKTKAALILLQDCTVTIIETDRGGVRKPVGSSRVVSREEIFPGDPGARS